MSLSAGCGFSAKTSAVELPYPANGAMTLQHFPPVIQKSMKQIALLLSGSFIAILFSSCAAGVVDRTEDRMDRREDRVDRRHYSGPGDRVEDYYDKRENVNDKLRGRRGLLY
jgi:hypothetical protein